MKLRDHATAALACLAAAGCYKQVPLETLTPSPATRVVAELTDSGVVAMGNALGPGAMEVEGVVSAASEAQWTLQLIRVDHRGGQSVMWNREPVAFARTLLANPMTVKLDRTRSWLAAAGIVAGAVIIAKSFNFFGGADTGSGGEIPQNSVVPLVPGIRR